jgi:cell division septation protein DedD
VEEDVSADAAAVAATPAVSKPADKAMDKSAADKLAQDKASQDKAAQEKAAREKVAASQKAEQDKAKLAAESVARAEAAKKADAVKKAEAAKTAAAKTTATAKAAPAAASALPEAWVVQVASLSAKDKADALVQKLRQKNYRAVVHQQGAVWKVIVGPELRKEAAESIKSRLAADPELKLSGWVQAYKP